ncbi:collagen alpha-5(VI) chain-like [Mercenaria mercenaria]|uniref:collagen alpha-5(VI) chain-like n=1 Tax=Mercenaria mercenaria TaxID=6596 RepID=UPI00234ED7B0|nr:collagen alpha-5(VI) chain-like [Mercenaria mercenaria]
MDFLCAQITLIFFGVTAVQAFLFNKDCLVTSWSNWSETNSNGIQTRTRQIMRFPSEGGQPCPVLFEERVDVDCQVSQWSAWGENFGFGQQSRSRTITQRPGGAGAKCPELEEVRYTGEVPSVNVTAKKVEANFIRPTGNYRVRRQAGTGSVRDLLLIMDSSGSIGRNGFTKANSEISRLIGLLCPLNGPFDERPASLYQHNQAAMLTFSTYVNENFDFDDYSTTAEIQKAIAGARYYGGMTDTASAFTKAISLFQPDKGARDESLVKREVLILTDGRSNDRDQTLAAVKELHEVADVYGLMTGSFSKQGMEELTAYVSSPIDEHLFYVSNLQDLTSLVKFVEDTKEANGQNWCAPFDV